MRTTILQSRLVGAATMLALAASLVAGRAQTPVLLPYVWTFPTSGQVTNFPDPSWIYWYNIPGNNLSVTDDVSMDVFNNPNSGCLIYSVPFANASNTQDVIFGTFGNRFGYDTSQVLNLTTASDIDFWIRADPSTAPRQVNGTNVDYGTINTGFFFPYSFEVEGSVTIPLSASNAWVHLSVPVNPGSSQVQVYGVAFSFATFGNSPPPYPALQNSIFYLDNIQVAGGVKPKPPTFGLPYRPDPGFNAIATTPGTAGEFNREQLVSAAVRGYTFVGQPSATYSWNIKSFPTGTGGNFQQHFFITGPGAPGPFDQAIDYNLPNVFWVTVQQSDGGVANMNFRLKTNEPGGNGMLFNTTSPTDTVNNPNGWPVEPIATLSDPGGAQGTWSVNVQNDTNITITSPSGLSTNFNLTEAQAQLFVDPVSLVLGGQPNNPNGAGKAVVYSSFSATGVATPISDDFLADSSFNTNLWFTNVASDINGVVLVPTNAVWWVPWSLPDGGFTLQTKSQLETAGGWTQPSPRIIRNGALTVGTNVGVDEALVLSTTVADPNKAYFQLIQYHASTLQVLFAGQTNDPGNVLGYDGTPTPISGATGLGADATVTINAVDPTFHIDTSITDVVSLTSSADPNATEPAPAPLFNGSLTTEVLFTAANTNAGWTVTATDVTNPNPPNASGLTAGTSVPIMVSP